MPCSRGCSSSISETVWKAPVRASKKGTFSSARVACESVARSSTDSRGSSRSVSRGVSEAVALAYTVVMTLTSPFVSVSTRLDPRGARASSKSAPECCRCSEKLRARREAYTATSKATSEKTACCGVSANTSGSAPSGLGACGCSMAEPNSISRRVPPTLVNTATVAATGGPSRGNSAAGISISQMPRVLVSHWPSRVNGEVTRAMSSTDGSRPTLPVSSLSTKRTWSTLRNRGVSVGA